MAESEHGTTHCDGCLMLAMVARAEKAEAALRATWAVLDRANALNPNDFKTGQGHLSPAFREVDFREAFKTVLDLLNDIEAASDYPPASPDSDGQEPAPRHLITTPHDGHGPSESCPGCPHPEPAPEGVRRG